MLATNFKNHKTLIISVLAILATSVFAQRADLEGKRNQLLKELEKTSSQIEATQKAKQTALERYLSFRKEVTTRTELIKSLESDLRLADQRLERNEDVVASLTSDLDTLQASYANLLRQSYRHQKNRRLLLFLLSSTDFNNFLLRWRFLQRLQQFRKRQIQLIRATQQSIETQTARFDSLRQEKQELLEHLDQEKKKFGAAMAAQNDAVRQLSDKEKKLKNQLELQQKAKNNLNDQIEAVIKNEIAAARKHARSYKATTTLNNNDNTLDGEQTKFKTSFEQLKGKLPMPVVGKITGKFGQQPHPELKNVTVRNDGIDIETQMGTSVRAIHEGKVVEVKFIPSYQNIVMVQHGDFYTVYSKMESVSVQKGATVQANQVLGKVATKNGKTEFHFQIWQNDQKLNPEVWLKK